MLLGQGIDRVHRRTAHQPEAVSYTHLDVYKRQERARAGGMTESTVDRLSLSQDRIRAIADAVRQVAALPDPVGTVLRGSTMPNGLQIKQVRVPFGVVGMIYDCLLYTSRCV